MDICIINWGYVKDIIVALISAGIPSIIAWKVFKSWKEQKNNEVIANEAKDNIKDLINIKKEIDILYSKESKEYEYVKEYYLKIDKNLDFFNFATNNKIKKYTRLYIRSLGIHLAEIGLSNHNGTYEKRYRNFSDKSDLLIKKLYPYALYKEFDKIA